MKRLLIALTLLLAGCAPQSDQQAAQQVTHAPEVRPANVDENTYVPTNAELQAFYNADGFNPYEQYVTGRPGLSNPSTDDLIEWAAAKWSIPSDWFRAAAVQESNWNMSQLGDHQTVSASEYAQHPPQARDASCCGVWTSLGIMQIKWRSDGSQWPGTEPLRWKSTAFNVDFYGATVRYYYDGLCDWCAPNYQGGDPWKSAGAWFNPSPWNNSGAQAYSQSVQNHVANRTWEDF